MLTVAIWSFKMLGSDRFCFTDPNFGALRESPAAEYRSARGVRYVNKRGAAVSNQNKTGILSSKVHDSKVEAYLGLQSSCVDIIDRKCQKSLSVVTRVAVVGAQLFLER